MTSTYSFRILDPRKGAEQFGLDERARTLGIEVTVPALAALCGFGNIDPQHGQHRGPLPQPSKALAAIDAAAFLDGLPVLPPDGATLATVRPDVDSIGAMAVIVLRRIGLAGYEAEGAGRDWRDVEQRVRQIAAADSFAAGPWASRPLPTLENPWPVPPATVSEAQDIAPLAVICSPAPGQAALPLADRVAIVACWLLWGRGSRELADQALHVEYDAQFARDRAIVAERIARACGLAGDLDDFAVDADDAVIEAARVAAEARTAMVRALMSGEINLRDHFAFNQCDLCGQIGRVPEDHYPGCAHAGILAVVESAHVGGLGLGYCLAPVVVAAMPPSETRTSADGRTEGGWRKVTIAAWAEGLIDRDGLLADLNNAEIEARNVAEQEQVYVESSPTTIAADVRKNPWGGGRTILGSPQGTGTAIPLDRIAGLVVRHLFAWKGRAAR